MLKTNILFIINPISGGKKKAKVPALIAMYLDHTKFNPSYSFTTHVGHASEIAAEAGAKNFDVVIAVGGDGTINEVAPKVIEQQKIFGIIPFGSGNGLARFLKIPMNSRKAIELINKFNVQLIDSAKLNNRHFFNMAGMGFDAHISLAFALNKHRGFKGYAEMFLKEMVNYKAQNYKIEIDGKLYEHRAFVVSVANSSQYGNNVHISPKSSLTDGLLDVCVVKPFPLYKIVVLLYQMLRGITDHSKMVEIIRGKNIKITREKEDSVHLDGEPVLMGNTIEVEVLPLSLRIITKSNKN